MNLYRKRAFSYGIAAVFAAVLCFSSLCDGEIGLAGVPRDSTANGNLFVEAWLGFRRDLDSLAQGRTHPAWLRQWFDAMPGFLVRDAARLATDPQVLLAAAARLSQLRGNGDRERLRELEQLFRGTDVGLRMRALSIESGDRRARRKALAELADGWHAARLQAALALAGAGDEVGREHLRRAVLQGLEGSDIAARALGRAGRFADAALLARASRRDPENRALQAARGELAMRRLFPDHHDAMLRRNPGTSLLDQGDGLYETWLRTFGGIIDKGARASDEIADAIAEATRHPSGAGDREVLRRRLRTFQDFWREIDQQVALPPRPLWPAAFSEAQKAVRKTASRSGDPLEFARRVSAQIAVCAVLGEELGYDRLGRPNSVFRALTPGSGRALDGNLATAWHTERRGTLDLEKSETVRIDDLWIMASCPGEGTSSAANLTVVGRGGEGPWTARARLESGNRYFQRIPIGGRSTRRLAIRFESSDPSGGICLAEIRVNSR